MQTQAEALSGQLAVERTHLLRFPAQESAEFASYLRSKGVRAEVAAAVVSDVAASSGGVDAALDIHAVREAQNHRCTHVCCAVSALNASPFQRTLALQRFEHGIDPEELGSASASAASSYAAFAVGAAVPLVRHLVLQAVRKIPVSCLPINR